MLYCDTVRMQQLQLVVVYRELSLFSMWELQKYNNGRKGGLV
jgi:hypothetical protein